ncbi:hypothetical protein S40285_02189 [Stachybotrys chlorohalonatus IBT 40285]|uniref:Chitin-binding type-4 domain-containing protein n=1 Tax=Stachybotrys chlorohalonatus (strain IBT 40285) TaxID=1283841 RepID=A0A084QB52_STAC4|nr:hypothetical protein S40285_02189 [Stachybotrys chlorohalonata IBT 40285]
MKTFQVLAGLGLAAMAHAHMEMTSPAPFKSKNNPNAGSDIDYSMTSPLSQDGSDFPCKGFHSLMGTAAGAPTADWQAGQAYSFTINGGAAHGGGSCQASLSYDNGASWSVIHSYIGNCPAQGESSFDFTVPADAPAGEAIFAWTWFNQIGNREMYMNCAAVNIAGGNSKRAALSGRPAMFVANTANGCETVEGTDVEFPDPGPDVSNVSSKAGPPKGSCAAGNSGGSPPSGNPVEPPSAPVASSQAPVATSAVAEPLPTNIGGGVFITAPASTPAAAPTNPPAVPTTLATITRSPESPVAQPTPSAPAVVEPPSSSPSPVPAPAPPAGGSGSFAPGEACTQEGLWNCIGGSQFQRCAAGQWSALMRMATGTTCVAGQSDNLQMLRKRVYGRPLIRA